MWLNQSPTFMFLLLGSIYLCTYLFIYLLGGCLFFFFSGKYSTFGDVWNCTRSLSKKVHFGPGADCSCKSTVLAVFNVFLSQHRCMDLPHFSFCCNFLPFLCTSTDQLEQSSYLNLNKSAIHWIHWQSWPRDRAACCFLVNVNIPVLI